MKQNKITIQLKRTEKRDGIKPNSFMIDTHV